jgi:N-acetylmuramoyl-L-alanine amidase
MALPNTATFAFAQLLEEYRNFEPAYPLLKEVSAAQWALESGWGTSNLAVNHLNYAGMKWRDSMEPFGEPVRHNAWDGVDRYVRFPDHAHFIAGYWARFDLVDAYRLIWHTAAEQGPSAFINKIGPIWVGGQPEDGQAYIMKIFHVMERIKGLV